MGDGVGGIWPVDFTLTVTAAIVAQGFVCGTHLHTHQCTHTHIHTHTHTKQQEQPPPQPSSAGRGFVPLTASPGALPQPQKSTGERTEMTLSSWAELRGGFINTYSASDISPSQLNVLMSYDNNNWCTCTFLQQVCRAWMEYILVCSPLRSGPILSEHEWTHIFTHCRVEVCTELFYAIIPTLIVSILFADLLSLHLVTFLIGFFFFILVKFQLLYT